MQYPSKTEFIKNMKEHFFSLSDEAIAGIKPMLKVFFPVEPYPNFDRKGLRYPIDHYNKIGFNVFSMPLFHMVTYADNLFVWFVENLNFDVNNILITQFENRPFQSFKAVEVGSLAYLCQNAKDVQVQQKAKELLLSYLVDYYEKYLDLPEKQSIHSLN